MTKLHLRSIVLAAMAVTACVATTSSSNAVEAGLSPYAKGFVGFMSGVLPPDPGLYVQDIDYYFSGSVGNQVRNGAVEVGINTTLNADFLQATYVTDFKILGGQYAFGGAIGWAWGDLSADIVTQHGGLHVSLSNNGFADSIWVPGMLGWHDGNFHWNAALLVYAPTGFYATNTTELSLGKNIWSLMPQVAATYFDPKSGWDVSGTLVYVTQFNNDATDYQSGDLLHLDWAIGKHLGTALEWEVGVAGNLVEQITGDSGSGAKLGPLKAESFGLGPAINYSTTWGKTPIVLGAKWEHDLEAHNTFKGDLATFSVTVVF
jgi:hypothetical protein